MKTVIAGNRYGELKMASIDLGERRRDDYGDLAKLAAGIEKVGLLHPIIVERNDSRFRLVIGGRRFKAIELLGWESIPARLVNTLTDEERREIELEENENRKDFTEHERRRTFDASKRMIEDVRRVGQILSTDSVDKPKPRGHAPKHGVAKAAVADALGIAATTITEAEHHVETAEKFPFMQGRDWRQSHVLAVRETLEDLPAPERDRIANVLSCAKLMDPPLAVQLIEKIAAKKLSEREEIYQLSESADPRDRSLALTKAAELPPMPDPRVGALDTAIDALRRASKPYPNDPLTPRIQTNIADLAAIRNSIRKIATGGVIQ